MQNAHNYVAHTGADGIKKGQEAFDKVTVAE